MSPRRVRVVACWWLLVLGAFVASGCNGAVSASPAEVVADSGERFAEAEFVRISAEATVKADSGEVKYTGVSAHTAEGILYIEEHYEAVAGPTEYQGRVIVVDDNLYATDDSGDWFVLSPWHQGARPEDVPDLGISSLLADYQRIARELEAIQAHSSEEVDGVVYKRYSGELDWGTFASESEPLSSAGTAEVDLWVDEETDLPFRMDYAAELTNALGSWTLTGTQTFEYDAELDPPEPPANARPFRDLEFPDAPCAGELFNDCLVAQDELVAVSANTCEGEGRRICLVPIGNISTELVVRLVEYYRTEYGLEINVLTPLIAPEFAVVPERNQIDAAGLLGDSVGARWPTEYADPDAVIIGITPIDMYDSDSHFRYVFGIKYDYSFPKAVVSMFRMTPEFYGSQPDAELTFERTRKLLEKYIGLLYYGIPTSSDPNSPMFDSILGPDDLDRMNGRLPVSVP